MMTDEDLLRMSRAVELTRQIKKHESYLEKVKECSSLISILPNFYIGGDRHINYSISNTLMSNIVKAQIKELKSQLAEVYP